MKLRILSLATLLVAILDVACATTPETTAAAPSEGFAQGPIASDAPTATAPSPSASSTPAPAAGTTATAGQRTGDGIDDENWLPRKDTAAYRGFIDASEVARRDPRAAADRFADVARNTPGFYAAWFNAGAAAEAAGDAAAAERHYREALKVRPDYGPALVNLTTLLRRTGREQDAARIIADALKAHDDKAGPHLANAVHAFATRDLVTAEREAREAIQRDERNVPAMLIMAQVFRGQGRLDTARFAIDNALALEPGNALLHVERGQILLALKERKEALVAYERAARLRPTLPEALEPYARLLLENGMATEARPVVESLIALDPKNARAQVLLGNALRATKQYPQAEQAYTKALQLDPNLDDVNFNLGVLYIDNALPGIDELARLNKGLEALKKFQSSGAGDATTKARLAEYVDATEKRVSRETKKREREAKRKTDEAKAPPATTPAPAPATTEKAPVGAPPPAPGGGT